MPVACYGVAPFLRREGARKEERKQIKARLALCVEDTLSRGDAGEVSEGINRGKSAEGFAVNAGKKPLR